MVDTPGVVHSSVCYPQDADRRARSAAHSATMHSKTSHWNRDVQRRALSRRQSAEMVIDDAFTARSHNYVTTDANGKFKLTFDSSDQSMHVYVLHKCNYNGKCALMRTYMLNSKDLLSDSISLTYELSNKKHTFEFCGEL
ncbi:hypothetical protein Q1695_006871 [Nippostrongylus brasiliensis]|nr:hypothetical protein Q1695_006871 [Nippostrongylus brasiliensis]